MNYPLILWGLSRVLFIEAALMVFPLTVVFIYGEPMTNAWSFLATMAILTVLGGLLSRKKPKNRRFFTKEGLILTAFTWIFLSIFGALPFVFSGQIPSLIDAWFETASGFTTTGSSILVDIELMSHSMLFWRSFTHFIGGMGIIVFTMALLPAIGDDTVHIMKAEVPGPLFGKILSKNKNTAQTLYIVYFVMFLITVFLLAIGDMPLFDSIIHAFGAAGTGGFGMKNGSVLPYQSAYSEIVLAVAMILFGVNFNLYFYLLQRKWRVVFKNEELRWYLLIIAAAVVFIALNTSFMYDNFADTLRHSFFTVSSIMTTTGFATVDFTLWPLASQIILLLLMFAGGMAGSTAGGLKISRIAIGFKTVKNEIRQVLQPHRQLAVQMDGKNIDGNTFQSVIKYFLVFTVVFWFLVFLIALDTNSFLTAFSAVAATINNIGPGLELVGPVSSFAEFSPISKIILTFSMLAGRLELYPILFIFIPQTWRKI